MYQGGYMFHIKTFNQISPKGLHLLSKTSYQVGPAIENPDAMICRSEDLHAIAFPKTVQVIARAGAGTNNIPVEKCTTLGIPVLNTPGANANAVKELVIAGMLLASRHIFRAFAYTQQFTENDDIDTLVEKNKKQFSGSELPGKTLLVIGLGNIGAKVANAAVQLGMHVIGFDPAITVQNAWELNSTVKQAQSLEEALPLADFVSLHIPLTDKTKHFIDAKKLSLMKKKSVLLNFSRAPIIEQNAVLHALQSNQLSYYVCDFPHKDFLRNHNIICLPHLGASTHEAEENCAIMAVNQLIDYLENGHITYSVNFPKIRLSRTDGCRLSIINQNIPNIVAQVSTVLSAENLNIIDMINKSRDTIACTLIDVNKKISDAVLKKIKSIQGVVRARIII